jgi:hypothetical protein
MFSFLGLTIKRDIGSLVAREEYVRARGASTGTSPEIKNRTSWKARTERKVSPAEK